MVPCMSERPLSSGEGAHGGASERHLPPPVNEEQKKHGADLHMSACGARSVGACLHVNSHRLMGSWAFLQQSRVCAIGSNYQQSIQSCM